MALVGALSSVRNETADGTLLLTDKEGRSIGIVIDVDGYNLLRAISDLAEEGAPQKGNISIDEIKQLHEKTFTLDQIFSKK